MSARRPRSPRAFLRSPCLGLVLAAVPLAGCAEVESTAESTYEPARLETVAGSDAKRVVFTAEGARRVGLRTSEVRRTRGGTELPQSALLYGPDGDVFVYTNPRGRSYLRRPVEVERVVGERALLSRGPRPGTRVVTVGAAEVYGTEFEVGN